MFIIEYVLVFWLSVGQAGGPVTIKFTSPWACENAIVEIKKMAEDNHLEFSGACIPETIEKP